MLVMMMATATMMMGAYGDGDDGAGDDDGAYDDDGTKTADGGAGDDDGDGDDDDGCICSIQSISITRYYCS